MIAGHLREGDGWNGWSWTAGEPRTWDLLKQISAEMFKRSVNENKNGPVMGTDQKKKAWFFWISNYNKD